MKRPLLPLLILLVSMNAPALAAVEGTVVAPSGLPLERAEVEHVESGTRTFTNRRGEFSLPDVEAPAILIVRHPRFEDWVEQLTETPTEPLSIQPVSKQTVFEEIVVSANRGGDSFSPVSIASTVIEPAEVEGTLPSSLLETITTVAGVSENGQGGLFQTYSIRGISRQRVATLISDMRIVGERRAGVSTSFVEPLLMGSVDLLRGPSSSYYGSGALGGVVQVFPQRFEGPWFATGYESQGNENYQVAGWGADGWSVGLARRDAGDAEDPEGGRIFSGFSQYSATVTKTWDRGPRQWELLLLPAAARDIAKANTRFESRPTTYPSENHLLAKIGVSGESGWRLSAYLHPNDLETLTVRVGESENLVDNEAFNFGWNFQKEVDLSKRVAGRFGLDYFGRRSVTATETTTDLVGGAPAEFQTTLDDGTEDDLATYGAVRFGLGKATLEAGGRLNFIQQSNADSPTVDKTAWSGFVGFVTPLGKGFELTANAGTGLRFPSLSERFFSGTTGRGTVIGNAGLDPERSVSADLGLRWYGPKVFVAASVYRNEIDDYIERVEVEPEVLTFLNLTSGTIEGFELEGFFQVRPSLRLSWGGHWIDGTAGDGTNLADIPAASFDLGMRYSKGAWNFSGGLEIRRSKDDPGSGELARPGAELLSASVSRQLSSGLALTVSGRNLLDESYFRSADDLVPLAAGRSVGLGITWSPSSDTP